MEGDPKIIAIIGYDDWHAIYVGGILHDQTHSIHPRWIVDAARGEPVVLVWESDERIGRYLADHGRFDHKSWFDLHEALKAYD